MSTETKEEVRRSAEHQWRAGIADGVDTIEQMVQLRSQLAQLTRERDAALHDRTFIFGLAEKLLEEVQEQRPHFDKEWVESVEETMDQLRAALAMGKEK